MTTPSTRSPQTALDAELEQITALDRVIRAAQAEQFGRIEAARLLAAELEGVTERSGSAEREFATRSFVAELATALTVHEATAGRLVGDARQLTGRCSATLAALASGVVCLGKVRTLLELATTLPAHAVAEFEEAALGRNLAETPSAFRRRLRRLRERLHPESIEQRRTEARSERRVCFDPAPDGMAWLSLHLEAERGVAIMAHLEGLAESERRTIAADASAAASDARTREQLKLDIAAGLMLGGLDAAAAAPMGIVIPKVYVTVPVLTLLGHSDVPAELDGYGPIDAETARRLAAHAPSFRRILTHPETGAYLSYGRNSYRVPADLAGYLQVRDGVCRFPGCSRTAVRCDIDHTDDWAAHGETSHDNLAHLCRKHHRLKHKTRWRMRQEPGGDIRWTSPTGREYTTSPAHPFEPARPPDPSVVHEKYPVEPPWAARPERSDDVAA